MATRHTTQRRPEAGKDSASNQVLEITRIFDAPREIVFKAWTDPKLLSQWWGPHGFTNPVCEVDLRPGGSIRIDMRGPDGTVYPMTGVYHEIVRPERLVYTASALKDRGTVVLEVLQTATFADHQGKTKLTLKLSVVKVLGEGEKYLAGMEAGWNQSLDRFNVQMGILAKGKS